MNRLRLRTRHRFVPLALLGALALSPACNKKDADQPAQQDQDKAASSSSSSATSSKTSEAPAAGGLVADPSDSPAIAEVGEVVATIQLPSGTKMSDVAAFIDYFQPGASMMLAMQLPALLEQAAGFDLGKSARLDAPMSLLILNPASHPKPLALLVEAKDPAKLSEQAKAEGHEVEQRDKLLLIGPAGVVDAAKDFAFANLTRYPDHSEIIIYPKLLMSSYASTLRDGIGASMAVLGAGNDGLAQMMRSYVEAIVALGEQTDRLVLSVGGGSGSADLIARVYPIQGSLLASYIAAQTPSDHALLSKLPAESGMMLASGHLRAGAAGDAFLDWSVKTMTPIYGSMSADEWMALFKPWLDNLDGSFAMRMHMTMPTPTGQAAPVPAMQMHALLGINDATTLRAAWREMLNKMMAGAAIEMMGMKVIAKHTPDALEHDGVPIDLYSTSVDASGLPPAQAAAMQAAGSGEQAMHLAAFDKVAAMTSADADGQTMRTLIDTVRGKQGGLELSGNFAKALEASKQRGDSMLMVFDFAAVMASMPTPPPSPIPFSGMSVGVGKHDAALSVRVSVLK
ncbi:MAG: hypothetical protein R6X02_02220 [Enhygromyxa sp.]